MPMDSSGKECPICMKALAQGPKTVTTPCCKQAFCGLCLVEAAARAPQRRSCPMCRTPFPAGFMDMGATSTDETTQIVLGLRAMRMGMQQDLVIGRGSAAPAAHCARFVVGNQHATALKQPRKGASPGNTVHRWRAFIDMAPAGDQPQPGGGWTAGDYIESVRFVLHEGGRDESCEVLAPGPFACARPAHYGREFLVELRVNWWPSE
eukprot:SAG22_NODE_2081_length_3037_cov_11.140912_1_plen_207_part_00